MRRLARIFPAFIAFFFISDFSFSAPKPWTEFEVLLNFTQVIHDKNYPEPMVVRKARVEYVSVDKLNACLENKEAKDLKFHVLLGIYDRPREKGSFDIEPAMIQEFKTPEGDYQYVYGNYRTLEKAEEQCDWFRLADGREVQPVGNNYGKLIGPDEAERIQQKANNNGLDRITLE